MNFAARAGRWSARHRKTAILGWLAFVLAAVVIGGAIGTQQLDPVDHGSGEAARADKTLDAAGFKVDSTSESILIRSSTATADDPAFKVVIADAARTVAAFDVVEDVRSPLQAGQAGLISKDRHSALVQYGVEGDYEQAMKEIDPILAAIENVQKRHPQLTVAPFGDASAGKALNEALADDFLRAELLAIPITLAILLLAFGALVAAGIPLLLGLTSVAAAIGLLALPSQLLPLEGSANSIVLLLGLAVGVDYSLFYLRREREERAKGRNVEASLEAAAATSGHAVLISGLTVLVSMAGLFLTGSPIFSGFGVATMLVVSIAIIGSLTVLPAVLSLLGDKVDKVRVSFVHRLRRDDGEGRVWGAIVDRVLRRPLVSSLAAGAVLIALAIPVAGIHTSIPGVSSLPKDLPVMATYEKIQAAFPGGPQPAVVAIQADDVGAPAVREQLDALRREALATGQMQEPIHVAVNDAGTVARVEIPLAGNGTDDVSNAALATLRDEVIPSTIGSVEGVTADVTGATASSKDFNDQMNSRAPVVFAFVLLLAFALLLVAFRSIVIAAKAIALNLLSVGAAYGVLVLIFQHGYGESLLGFESNGGIVSWLPLFMFVILFGLSMDYHVFILSRVREGVDRGLSTDEAVARGIKSTAGVVTSAAAIMIAVFSIFATLSMMEMKQMGVGLAVAILIDATIIRAVLLPALMKLLGDWNWYLPTWLDWLPRVSLETPAVKEAPQESPALAA
jgi:uncharacterized membrane protein YdfJ with MMPL/SSD domain